MSSHARKRKWLFRLFAIVFGAMFATAIGELALRVLGVGYPSFYTPDFYCGSRLRPNTQGVWISEGRGYVSINSLGFRGDEFQTEKPAAVLRIAVLGDSMIEAMQVNQQDTFCEQLKQQLRKSIDDKWRIEVINCGVAGYGTAQELLLLRHYVLPLRPDLVLLSFFPQNDIRNNHLALSHEPPVPYFHIAANNELNLDESFRQSAAWLTAMTSYEQSKAWLTNHSRVLQVLKQAKLAVVTRKKYGPQSVESQLQSLYDEAPYVYRLTDDPLHAEAIKVTGRLLQEVSKECATHNVPLVIFSATSPLQVYPKTKIRGEIASRNNINDLLYSDKLAVQLCDSYARNFFGLASIMQRELKSENDYYHGFRNVGMGFGHWNENGHSTAARLMAGYILEENLLQRIISARRSL